MNWRVGECDGFGGCGELASVTILVNLKFGWFAFACFGLLMIVDLN
jgi:hypothetical protein